MTSSPSSAPGRTRGLRSRGEYRGSRKHVLDWVEQPHFLEDLQALVAPVPCQIAGRTTYRPRGYDDPVEARLDSFGRAALPGDRIWSDLRRWWLRHPKGANTPNWDLAVRCDIAGRPGLLLVEAKANVPELSEAPKPAIVPRAGRSVEGLRRSRENHEQIAAAIEAARRALAPRVPGIAIHRDRHYQLSNRLAFAWKLASLGVPTVLLYLGFTGDAGIRDVGEPLRDAEHWGALFSSHLTRVCPSGIAEEPIEIGDAAFWVLCRARPVLEPSAVRRARATMGEATLIPGADGPVTT